MHPGGCVEQFGEGGLTLAEHDGVDAVLAQEVLGALHVGAADDDQRGRHVGLHRARDLEHLGDVPSVAAEPEHRLEPSGDRLPGPSDERAAGVGVEPVDRGAVAEEVDEFHVARLGRAAPGQEIGFQGAGGERWRAELGGVLTEEPDRSLHGDLSCQTRAKPAMRHLRQRPRRAAGVRAGTGAVARRGTRTAPRPPRPPRPGGRGADKEGRARRASRGRRRPAPGAARPRRPGPTPGSARQRLRGRRRTNRWRRPHRALHGARRSGRRPGCRRSVA